jgi:hypothetical protein
VAHAPGAHREDRRRGDAHRLRQSPGGGDADIEGDIGIRTNGADASFDYVFVVAIGA